MMHVLGIAALLLFVSCEPIPAEEQSTSQAQTSPNAPGSGSNTGGSSSDPSFDLVVDALRSQYLNLVYDVFDNLQLTVAAANCEGISQQVSIDVPASIPNAEILATFGSIASAIEACFPHEPPFENQKPIMAEDLRFFEEQIQKALGGNILPVCKRDSDCMVHQDHGFFGSAPGPVYSKLVHGSESAAIHSYLRDLMTIYSGSEYTDYSGVEVSDTVVETYSAKCVEHVCVMN